MQFTTLMTAALAAAGVALAAPATPTPSRTLGKRSSASVIEAIMPSSSSCSGRGDQCRTAAEAAPYLVKAMNDYGISTNREQAGILALIAKESGELQYKENLQYAAEGQGTSSMQSGHYNVEYAATFSALASESITASNVLSYVTADKYNFGSGPWLYSIKCADTSDVQGATSADDWFDAYMTCIGVDVSEDGRLDYWNTAKDVFGIS